MRKLLLILLLSATTWNVIAQQKHISLQEAMLSARTTLAPENLKMLQFIKETNDYAYLKKINETESWMKGGFELEGESVLLTLSEVNRRLRSASMDTFKAMPAVQFNKDNWIVSVKGIKLSFSSVDDSYKVLVGKELAGKQNLEENSRGAAAYLDSFDLFVYVAGEKRRVTTDGSEDIVYASSVHRDEFGITKGTFWSNAGKKLAFYRMDQRMVKDYPIIDWSVTPAVSANIKYPMAGDTSHQVSLMLYDLEKRKVIRVQTPGPDEHYLTNVAWSPDDRFVFIAELNRDQNHMQLNQYDAETGIFIKTLFEERSEQYVEPLVPMLFLKNDQKQFIWQSRRDGWNHLYLYSLEGKLLKQLTSGNWEVVEVKGFDAKGNNLFYISTQQSPLSRNLYKLDLKDGKKMAVTTGDFVHNTQLSTDGKFVIDNTGNIYNPRTVSLINVKSGKSKLLLQAGDPLKDYRKGELKLFTLPGKQGEFDLYCRMYLPVDFDSTKKYPVVVYWYGGPHNQLITNSWNGGSGDYWFRYLADNGYIAFSMDVRGSQFRGREFEASIFRRAGKMQMEDLLRGVGHLKSLSYVDAGRMGLFGWSYGGFLTTNFMLTYPDVFKAAVAGGPVMDWKLYEIMYTERYMDRPEENPQGYKETNLIDRAAELKGKLLLIHGLQDPVVLQQHSVNFVRSAVEKGIQVDYMIYPGHEHNVTGKDRVHLYQKVTDYLFTYLK
jgi:dipeptidyl-peptidase-4